MKLTYAMTIEESEALNSDEAMDALMRDIRAEIERVEAEITRRVNEGGAP